jgi:hypothetical protein
MDIGDMVIVEQCSEEAFVGRVGIVLNKKEDRGAVFVMVEGVDDWIDTRFVRVLKEKQMEIEQLNIFYPDGDCACFSADGEHKCGVFHSANGKLVPYVRKDGEVTLFNDLPFSYKISEEAFDSWIEGGF